MNASVRRGSAAAFAQALDQLNVQIEPERRSIRRHATHLHVPKFKGAEDGSVFCEAAATTSICVATTTLPGVEQAGLFRVQAKRYGNDRLERVLAIA